MPPESIVPALLADEAFRLLLVFLRIGSAMLIMPGLAEAYIAARVRLLLALGLSLALVGPLATMLPAVPGEPLALARLLAAEAVLGLFIGSAVKVIFAALHIAGTTIAFHAGLATAAIFDPYEATQAPCPATSSRPPRWCCCSSPTPTICWSKGWPRATPRCPPATRCRGATWRSCLRG